jgi:hypothetical protein
MPESTAAGDASQLKTSVRLLDEGTDDTSR